MENKVAEVPGCLKQMVRLITRSFESIEESLIIDVLIRYKCVSEKQLQQILKFDYKIIRAKLTNLKIKHFITMRTRMAIENETRTRVSFYYINYLNFFNAVKYKLMTMRQKLENVDNISKEYPYLWCSNDKCQKTYMLWEIGECFDEETCQFYCTFCKSLAEENLTTLPKKDAKLKLDKFNEELRVIMDIIKECEGVVLESSLMNPLPYIPRCRVSDTSPINPRGKLDAPAGSAEKAARAPANKRNKKEDDTNVQIIVDSATQDKLPQFKKVIPPWFKNSSATTTTPP